MQTKLLTFVAAVCLLGIPAYARAQVDEIQVYDGDLTPPGKFNLTWHNN